MSRLSTWFAALSSAALLAGGCARAVASRPHPPNVAEACAGISDEQTHTFVRDLRANVQRVETVREPTKTKPFVLRPVGADVYVRATSGMTAEWLARLTQCHLAREEHGTSCDPSSCPLGLAGTTTEVSSTGTGFVVAIRSPDFDVAREIARRAASLVGTGSDASGEGAQHAAATRF